MANTQQAPKLLERGSANLKGSKEHQVWIYDADILSFIMKESGTAHGQLKLMMYLMGNKAGSWKCSTEDVLNKTGITSKQSLSTIKKALKARGWIDYAEGDHITVLYDNIIQQMKDKKEKEK